MTVGTSVKLFLTWLILSLALFPVGCGVSYIGLMVAGTQMQKKAVEGGLIKDTFPLLVIVPGKAPGEIQASVVIKRDLDAFKAAHTDYSFLVPSGKEDAVNQQLKQLAIDDAGTKYFSIAAEVKPLAAGRQEIHLEASMYDDAPNEGWYEAADKDFKPKSQKEYVPLGLSIGASFMAAPIGAVLAMVGAVLLVIRNERIRKKQMAVAAAQSQSAQ